VFYSVGIAFCAFLLRSPSEERRAQYPTRPKEKLYDGPTVGQPPHSRKKKEKGILSVQGVMSNMLTGYNARNAKDGGTSRVLRLKEI